MEGSHVELVVGCQVELEDLEDSQVELRDLEDSQVELEDLECSQVELEDVEGSHEVEVVFMGQAAARVAKNERTETALMEFILSEWMK